MTGQQLFTAVYVGAPVVIVALGALATWFALHAPVPDEPGAIKSPVRERR
jgi:hypothetical protein